MKNRILFLFMIPALLSMSKPRKQSHFLPHQTLLKAQWSLVSHDRKYAIAIEEVYDDERLYLELYDKLKPKIKLPSFAEFRKFLMEKKSREGFILRAKFGLEKHERSYPHIELVLNDIHTYCEVRCNGKKIGTTENAFRTYRFELKPFLKQHNQIDFIFKPTTGIAQKLAAQYPFSFPVDNQSDSIKTAPFVRQPQQHFGWDFCDADLYMGMLSQPVLKFDGQLRYNDHYFENQTLSKDSATCTVVVNLSADFSDSVWINLSDALAPPTGATERYFIQKGTHEYRFPLVIRQPNYWSPKNTRGFLSQQEKGFPTYAPYEEYISFSYNTAKNELHIPIIYAPVNIQLNQAKDSIGYNFQFAINGEPVFAKGVNLVLPNQKKPRNAEYLNTLIDPEQLNWIAQSDINMIRIWGGGTYLPETFYHWADEHGILIWQDFMFSGTMYPYDTSFLNNVTQEVRAQILRLSKHPSVVLFCGNNELEVAWKNWGWPSKYNYSPQQQKEISSGYKKLFHDIIPQEVKKYGREIPYISSSPISNWGKPEDFHSGDNHDWRVWHGEMLPDVFFENIPRFSSEYGAPSLPSKELIERKFGKSIDSISEQELASMVISYKGWRLLKWYIENSYGNIRGAEAWIYFSQHFQAEALRKGIESHRLNRHRCNGSLLWQLNDADTVVSWSLFDKVNIAKQAWYAVKRDFSSSTICYRQNKDSVKVYFMGMPQQRETICLKWLHRDGKLFAENYFTIEPKDELPILIKSFSLKEIEKTGNLNEMLLCADLKAISDGELRRKTHLFVSYSAFRWKPQEIKIEKTGKDAFLLSTGSFQSGIYMPLPHTLAFTSPTPTLNFFDLLPGEKVPFYFSVPERNSIEEIAASWRSVNYFMSQK